MRLMGLLFGRMLATDEEGEQRVGILAGTPCSGSMRLAPLPTAREPR